MSRWGTFSGDELDAIRQAFREWSGPEDPENDLLRMAGTDVAGEVDREISSRKSAPDPDTLNDVPGAHTRFRP